MLVMLLRTEAVLGNWVGYCNSRLEISTRTILKIVEKTRIFLHLSFLPATCAQLISETQILKTMSITIVNIYHDAIVHLSYRRESQIKNASR